MLEKALIYTNENCIGCNKCIKTCPVLGANISSIEHGSARIEVDGNRCIACGSCLDNCVHDAREYNDDTDRFFQSLKEKKRITLLVAPAFKANYPDQYELVLGALKELGVNRIISVSFGADITTWAYLNYIKQYNFMGGISQPCPAVVRYIERFIPELLPKLFPVQSPLMCAAIYCRKMLGITDELAFISPCIAKKMEIEDENNAGLVQYNVTFRHLMEYIKKNNILSTDKRLHSEVEYGMGAYYPTPGGLAETVRWFMGTDVFIRQMEGEIHLYRYLEAHKDLIKEDKTPFLFYDVLNCKDGCICGTAVDPEKTKTDESLFTLLKIREEVKNEDEDSPWAKNLSRAERLERYNEQFKDLDLTDYLRKYTDRSGENEYRIPNDKQLESIYLSMRKDTETSRKINCSCCGYDNCYMMAEAIFNGFNRKENCIYYDKKMMEYLDDKSHRDLLTGLLNKITFNETVKGRLKEANKEVALFIIDFDNFKHVNDNFGHRTGDVVLEEFSKILNRTFTDGAWIGRIGGDEFMVYLEHNTSDEIIAQKCEAIESELRRLVVGEASNFSCSIGVVIDHAKADFDSMYQHADDALYVAKAKGKACFVKWHSHSVEHTNKKVIYVITKDQHLYPMIQETYGDKYQYVEMKEAERALIDIGLYQDYLSSVFIDYDSLDMTEKELREYVTSRPIFQEVPVIDVHHNL